VATATAWEIFNAAPTIVVGQMKLTVALTHLMLEVLDQIAMDQTMTTCILVALQKNPVGSGKGLAMAMTNVWTLLSVVYSIVISHPILQIIAVFKNLTAAIQLIIH